MMNTTHAIIQQISSHTNNRQNKTQNIDIVQYVGIATNKYHNDPMERKWFVLIVVKINQMEIIIAKDVSWLIYILISLHMADILTRSLLKQLFVHRVDVSFENNLFGGKEVLKRSVFKVVGVSCTIMVYKKTSDNKHSSI